MRNFMFFAILAILYALLVFSVGLVLSAPQAPPSTLPTLPPNWQSQTVQPLPTPNAEQLLKWQMIQQQQQIQKPAFVPSAVPGSPAGVHKFPVKPVLVAGHATRNGTTDSTGKGSSWSWFWDLLLGADNAQNFNLGRNANATANATKMEMEAILETGMALMGAILGRDQCDKKAACLAGDVMPDVQGRDFVFLAAERLVPQEWQPVYQVAKNSMMFKEDCKKYSCST